MSFNGSGTFTIPNTFVFDTVISETEVNANFSDVATGLSTCITKDGQTTVTANIPLSNYRITGLGNGTAGTDAAAVRQIQSQVGIWCGAAGGTADAITLTPSPSITAYAAGQRFTFVASADNTGAATVAVSGLTTKAIENNGSALTGAEIATGLMYDIVYDGTQFQLSKVDIGARLVGTDISSATSATVATGDLLPIADVDDSNALKKVTAQSVADLSALSGADISGATSATVASGDLVAIADVDDSNALKKVTAQSIADLAGGGGVFTESFESADQTITAGGALTLAHGMSAAPKFVQMVLECQTAELGFSVNDQVFVNNADSSNNAGTNGQGTATTSDATNVYVRFGNNSTSFGGPRKDTGAPSSFTNANWKLIVRAYA